MDFYRENLIRVFTKLESRLLRAPCRLDGEQTRLDERPKGKERWEHGTPVLPKQHPRTVALMKCDRPR